MLDDEQRAMLRLDDQGLIPTVVQHHTTGEVLMVAWMSEASLQRTLEVGETVFYSRSRAELWHKGATSGNTQRVVDLRVDCDGDTLLALVEPAGPACHTGEHSCFHRRLPHGPAEDRAVAPPLAGEAAPDPTPAPTSEPTPEPRSTP